MEIDRAYPFDKLKLPSGENLLWFASNPTFHRGYDYGIVLTDQAIYLRSWLFSVGRGWRRIALQDVHKASFKDSRLFPCLELLHSNGITRFRTPHDWYKDEMDFDRKNLVQAACFIEQCAGRT